MMKLTIHISAVRPFFPSWMITYRLHPFIGGVPPFPICRYILFLYNNSPVIYFFMCCRLLGEVFVFQTWFMNWEVFLTKKKLMCVLKSMIWYFFLQYQIMRICICISLVVFIMSIFMWKNKEYCVLLKIYLFKGISCRVSWVIWCPLENF